MIKHQDLSKEQKQKRCDAVKRYRNAMSPEKKAALAKRHREYMRGWQARHPGYSAAMSRRWVANNKERHSLVTRKNELRRRYGITPEERDAMNEKQGGKCAICGDVGGQGNAKRLDIEHSHATGKVRGLVCRRCNLYLGVLESEWMNKYRDVITKYLEL